MHPSDPSSMWNKRYAESELAYGDLPNDWVRETAPRLPAGPVLCIAEGQGRNALFLAERGHSVSAMDASSEGMAVAARLAEQRGLALQTSVEDLALADLGSERWAVIVSVFAHLPPPLRRDVHRRVVQALAPGGMLVLEAYTPQQIGRGTGGPPNEAMMMQADVLTQELKGLEFLVLEEREREVNEGVYHRGLSHVVRVLARKPKGNDTDQTGGHAAEG